MASGRVSKKSELWMSLDTAISICLPTSGCAMFNEMSCYSCSCDDCEFDTKKERLARNKQKEIALVNSK